ncbi:MAG: hypothetical protein K2M07_00290 [Muribaculaceae bacterium]|nr:hypothetical protein [Muribaculaceae bacterium]
MMKSIVSRAPYILILFITIGSFMLDSFTPMMGDDMSKWIDMGGPSDCFLDHHALSFLAGHYMGCNGRIFDGLGPLLLNLLPGFVASVLIGLMNGLFFYAMTRSAGVMKRGAFASLLITVALFTLPWWDSMFLRVCQINYLWGTIFALLFVKVWFSDIQRGKLMYAGLFILGTLAGCFHEQIGVAMTAYFGIRILLTRCRDIRLWMFAGLCSGTLLTLASPAIWQRNTVFLADYSRLGIVLNTLPWVAVLFIITLTLALIPVTRKLLNPLLKSEFGAYLIIALFCSAITIYSTTPGRTGWLPESFSLVALVILLTSFGWHISRIQQIIFTGICLIAVSAHFYTSVKCQYQMWNEYNEAVDNYRHSTDGNVRMMSYTQRTDVPILTLYRVKGLPDSDDIYLKRIFNQYYGKGMSKPLTLIETHTEISDTLPEPFTLIYNSVPDTIMVMDTPEGRKVITPFQENGSQKYLLERMVVDPGDNWHSVTPEKS